jgi:hypothetical protein
MPSPFKALASQQTISREKRQSASDALLAIVVCSEGIAGKGRSLTVGKGFHEHHAVKNGSRSG